MKKIITLMLLALLVFAVFSCDAPGDASGDTDATVNGDQGLTTSTDEHGRQVLHATYIENIAEYKIVRADGASQEIRDLAVAVCKEINSFTGADIKVGSDFNPAVDYEILLGDTRRTESQEACADLGYNDYRIKMVGNKIVIAAGSDKALAVAAQEFIDNFMFDQMVVVPNGAGLFYRPDYKFDKISIGGKDISEYKVYSTNEDASNLFSTKVLDKYSGQLVETAKNMSEKGPYIVLEPTSMDYVSYSAELRDGNLYVSGSYKSCVDFLDYYVKKQEKNVDINGKIEGKLDTPTIYTKAQLMEVLKTVYNEDTVIIGEQTNTNSYPSDVLERFYNATGKYPGLIGLDVAGYGLKLTSGKCTDERKSQVFCELVEFAEMGGIVQLHSHMVMPKETWDPENEIFRSVLGKDEAIWQELITEGTALNENFKKAMSIEAEFVKYFHDIGVPVLWRPFHEMNANWFWWGVSQEAKTIDASCFTNMWKYMYEYYNSMGIDSLVWVYSPNVANGWIDVMYTYPGDEYADIVGLDWYTEGGYEIDGSGNSYAKLMNTEKVTNICEFGLHGDMQKDKKEEQLESFNCLDFENMIKQMFSDGYKLGYLLTWTAQDSMDWWGYGKEAMASGTFIDRDTLPSYFEKVSNK